jgi:hypothetical protein
VYLLINLFFYTIRCSNYNTKITFTRSKNTYNTNTLTMIQATDNKHLEYLGLLYYDNMFKGNEYMSSIIKPTL